MKTRIITLTTVAALAALTPSFAQASTSYEQVWSPEMNQTSYWSPWECAKYEGHDGFIPARYDAAIIKDANVVKVYPDLSTTGDFNATGATNPANGQPFQPPHSWVMKCTFPDTPPTTLPETTQPPTTVPDTTVPETTIPPVTTVPGEESPNVCIQHITGGPNLPEGEYIEVEYDYATGTTEFGFLFCAPTGTPTTSILTDTGSVPEVTEPATPGQLPSTGTGTWMMALFAALMTGTGVAVTRLARR